MQSSSLSQQIDDRFVLNVLEEGNYQYLIRHFFKRFPPGADRFARIKTVPASNGSPIIAESSAYIECQISIRLESSDRWIVSNLETGRVATLNVLTIVSVLREVIVKGILETPWSQVLATCSLLLVLAVLLVVRVWILSTFEGVDPEKKISQRYQKSVVD